MKKVVSGFSRRAESDLNRIEAFIAVDNSDLKSGRTAWRKTGRAKLTRERHGGAKCRLVSRRSPYKEEAKGSLAWYEQHQAFVSVFRDRDFQIPFDLRFNPLLRSKTLKYALHIDPVAPAPETSRNQGLLF